MSKKTDVSPVPTIVRRLAPEEREQQIVSKAIDHFATHGFSGSTRELARQIGVTQPLLYRYFPSKEALIERVYDKVYKWNSEWELLIGDRSVSLKSRLTTFYKSYARTILTREWIRIFIFAGLDTEGINDRYLTKLRKHVFLPVLREIRDDLQLPAPTVKAHREAEIEIIWSLHAGIFYLGVRKWIYGLPIPDDIDLHVERQIELFLNGSSAVLKGLAEAR
ncbi:TetR/AcrR family transcriptional regulator [Pseudomonas syringae pv. dysoxyli]|uniref:TetR/AcrR family transcriptional regulator n=1 Tax=Pseudomonas syringae TaxID=317 RepID=UPI0013728784|nr:TetR/AcrR family transcriptional regulator [Pseudomonas syringae]NAO28854.1 TetR/AcrR family transcriptional regulator [Pseudomonas syringae pv. dysoxyli]